MKPSLSVSYLFVLPVCGCKVATISRSGQYPNVVIFRQSASIQSDMGKEQRIPATQNIGRASSIQRLVLSFAPGQDATALRRRAGRDPAQRRPSPGPDRANDRHNPPAAAGTPPPAAGAAPGQRGRRAQKSVPLEAYRPSGGRWKKWRRPTLPLAQYHRRARA